VGVRVPPRAPKRSLSDACQFILEKPSWPLLLKH